MEARMYIGTDKGVVTLQSRDGHAWETESQGLQSWGVPSVAYVPGEPNKVIAGTRGDGVWISEDAGEWTKPSYGRRGPGRFGALPSIPGTRSASTPAASRSTSS